MFDARACETGLLHPLPAIRTGEVESALGLNQHIGAHQQAEALVSGIIDQASWTINAPPFGNAAYALRSSSIFL